MKMEKAIDYILNTAVTVLVCLAFASLSAFETAAFSAALLQTLSFALFAVSLAAVQKKRVEQRRLHERNMRRLRAENINRGVQKKPQGSFTAA